MTNSIQITIDIPIGEAREQLIARLSLLDFDGFEEREEQLISYYSEGKIDERELDEILVRGNYPYSKSILFLKNWNADWESSFSPVLVNDFCLIRADFHLPVSGVQHEIIVTPKMSFGTGHHPTTYLMIQEMEKLDFNRKLVADFGTGTGILAILAEKLGGKHIIAIDNDDWSIENAEENIKRNCCNAISITKSDSFITNKKFDIILANINKNVILQNLSGLVFGLNKGGKILLSGLLPQDEEDILLECSHHNLLYQITVERGNWISMLLSY